MATQFTTPNLYQVSGGTIHVSYSTTGIDGQPHFSYQDAMQAHSFRGNEIRTVECDLGLVVSVVLRRTVDTGSTTFSLLVPHVNLVGIGPAPIQTEGITTVHRFSVAPAFNHGQRDFYTVTPLGGTAAHVVF